MPQKNSKIVELLTKYLGWQQGSVSADDVAKAVPDAFDEWSADDQAAYLRGLTPEQILALDNGWPDDDDQMGQEYMDPIEFEDKYAMSEDDWVLDGVLPRGEMIAIVGSAGEGKTFISMGIAIAASAGLDYGPFKVSGKQRTVIYITEESLGEVAGRLKRYRTRWNISTDVLKQNLRIWPVIHQLIVRDRNNSTRITAKEIYRMIRVGQLRGKLPQQIDLIVLDYFRRASIEANENDNGDVSRTLKAADKLAKSLNCGMIIVHHKGKNKEGGARGASAFADFVYGLIETSGGNLQVVNRTTAGDLIFVDTEKETNMLSANGPYGKQLKGGTLDDVYYCLVAQDNFTVSFIDKETVEKIGLNDEFSALAARLLNLLKGRANTWVPRQDILDELKCDGGNLSRAWKELEDCNGFEKDKQGRDVLYRFTGVPL